MVIPPNLLLEVFTQRNFVADFIWLKFNFILKTRFLSHSLENLGNVCTPSIARWKARGWLPIRHNWTFFTISHGWDVISGNLSKSACFVGGGSLWPQISYGRGRRPPTTVRVRNLQWLPFRTVITISTVHCLVLSQSTRVTDRQADKQNYDSSDRCSRGKNLKNILSKDRKIIVAAYRYN